METVNYLDIILALKKELLDIKKEVTLLDQCIKSSPKVKDLSFDIHFVENDISLEYSWVNKPTLKEKISPKKQIINKPLIQRANDITIDKNKLINHENKDVFKIIDSSSFICRHQNIVNNELIKTLATNTEIFENNEIKIIRDKNFLMLVHNDNNLFYYHLTDIHLFGFYPKGHFRDILKITEKNQIPISILPEIIQNLIYENYKKYHITKELLTKQGLYSFIELKEYDSNHVLDIKEKKLSI